MVSPEPCDKLNLLYLHYHNAYSQPTRQDNDYTWAASTHNVTLRFGHAVFARLRDDLKPLYLHYHSAYGHQTWQDSG